MFHPGTITALRQAETTLFHPDGSRTVIGPLFSVHYTADGEARVVPTPDAASTDTLRWDLAA